MVLLDGKKCAEEITKSLKRDFLRKGASPTLAIIQVGENPVSQKFIEKKQVLAKDLGVTVKLFRFGEDISGTNLRKKLSAIVHDKDIHGVIVQLPLPPHIQSQDILNAVTPEKDIDVLSARAIGDFAVGKNKLTPPVVGAIEELFRSYDIRYKDKKIVLVGGGRLVGKPIADWLTRQGIGYSLLTDAVKDIAEYTRQADIIISGTGVSGLINGDMVKDGVIVIDAGTSESGGRVVGDVDFDSVSKKALYITPVPGGVGPLTVAMLFRNLYNIVSDKK